MQPGQHTGEPIVNGHIPKVCQGCGKTVKKFRYGTAPRYLYHNKRSYPHKCPHGKPCQSGHPLNGIHSNSNSGCRECMATVNVEEIRAKVAAYKALHWSK